MGNHSSSHSHRSLLRHLRLVGPTREDYKAYVDDLLELQKFLNEKFISGHLRNSARYDEFDTEYLDALKIKLEQLQNVRRHVTNVPTTLMRLLDALEPQCQRAVDELTRLQAIQCPSPTAATTSVVPSASADDEDASAGVDTPKANDGKLLYA